MSKICNKCNIEYSTNEFRLNYNTCKHCHNELDKIRKKNLMKIKSETLIICEKCGLDKPLKYFAKLKKYYKRKICLSCYPIFLNEQKAEWCKKEHNTNMNYRIKKSLAARLRNVISKENTTMNYIGCNIQYLREWFEYNFTSEMSWDNYDSYWSIDHIIPVKYFDLTNEDEKLKCWNWTNLMPVTINYNSSKKEINLDQINFIINQIEKFKEEGSTTKWFSKDFTLNLELVESKKKETKNK